MHKLTYLLMVIGGLNWLLYGIFENALGMGWLDHGIWRIVFIIVGLATIADMMMHKKMCKGCCAKGGHSASMPSDNPTPGGQPGAGAPMS
jgi:uncharacterized membrane protein YuzA (DUF378 family)